MTTRVTVDREIREDRPVQPTIHVSRPLQRLPVLVGLLTLVSALTLAVQNEAQAQTQNLPVISITADSYFAYERDTASFTLTASPAPSTALTVLLDVTELEGHSGVVPSNKLGSQTFTFPANQTSATYTISLQDSSNVATSGGLDPGDPRVGKVTVELSKGTGYTVGEPTYDYADVFDWRFAPVEVSISRVASPITEGGTAQFTITADPAPMTHRDVRVLVADSGDFAVSGQAGERQVHLAAGATTTTLTVTTDDDITHESPGTITATLLPHALHLTVGSPNSATVTVNDNDDPPQPAVSFASAAASAAESAGTRNVRVNLSPAAPSGGLTLAYSVTGTATAGNGNDFTIQNSGTLSITASATTATIPVAINDDNTVESSETVILTLTRGTGYTLGSTTTHTLTITDNDNAPPPQPAVSFASASSSAAESAGTRNVRVNLSPAAPSGGLTLAYSVTGTATAGNGNDYTIQNSGTLSITAGATTATIPVAINDDNTVESSETVILTLTRGTGYTLGSTTAHTLTITDNDNAPPAQPAVSFASASSSAAESAGTRNVRVNLSSVAPSGGLTVSYSVAGTATSGNDYTIQNSGTVSVTAGATAANIPVAINDDSTVESSETVDLTLTRGTGYTLGNTTAHTLTITDNDSTPPSLSTVTITRQSASVTEGTNAVFTVSASPAPTANLTVKVAVTQSGNYINTNYVTTHNVVIAASTTIKQLVIPTINDANDEANGWVTASINTDSAYTRGSPSSVRININDNDVYTPPQPRRTTGNTGYRPPATTTTTTTTTTTARPDSNTGDGSSSSDGDGDSGDGSSSSDDGGSSDGSGSSDGDGSGSGGVAPSDSSAGVGGQSSSDPESATPTGPVVLEVVGGGGVEEGEDAVFTITASRAPATDLTVTVFVDRDGNFVAGRERGTKTTLLLAGQTSVIYRVPTLDGNADEPDGAVLLSLKPGPGYEIGEPSAATVAVADNDPGDYDRNSAPPQPTTTTQPPPATAEPGDSNAGAAAAPSGGGGDLVELLPAALTEEPDPPKTSPDPPPDIDEELDAEAEAEAEGHDEEDQEVVSAPIPGDSNNEPGTAESTGGAVSPIVPLTMIAVIAASIFWLFFASRRRASKPQYSASKPHYSAGPTANTR